MDTQEKAPSPVGGDEADNTFPDTTDNKITAKVPKVKRGTKERAILEALASGRSLNRFEAARDLHDWCLHSTVSTLQSKGIKVHREREIVPCLNGDKTTDVMRYSLTADQIVRAQELLGAGDAV